ncbi:MAG: Rho termination protein [Desulfococcus sp. 4484_241]|nr:MAG: Rho termination protein [Desulfococcus sp. 4484_241]
MTEEEKTVETTGAAAEDGTGDGGRIDPKTLEKMTATELREVAMSIPEITGAHGMKKEQLLSAIRKAWNIPEEVKKDVSVIQGIKARIRELKRERARALEAGDSVRAVRLRRQISKLKKKTRRAAA